MDQVASQDRPRGNTQEIDTAHIAQQLFPQVVNMVLFYMIVAGNTVGISPHPAAGYAGIKQIMDVVVADIVTETMPRQHTHRGMKNDSTVVNMVIGYHIVTRASAESTSRIGT